MTANQRHSGFYRPSVGEVAYGQEGDELRAFGFTGPDGHLQFSLSAKIVQLLPEKKTDRPDLEKHRLELRAGSQRGHGPRFGRRFNHPDESCRGRDSVGAGQRT